MEYNEYIDIIKSKVEFVSTISKAFENSSKTTITKLTYEVYISGDGYPQEYLVATYRGGAIAVRSCNYDSLDAIVDEIAKLSHGGYYEEIENYKNTKEKYASIYNPQEENFVIL